MVSNPKLAGVLLYSFLIHKKINQKWNIQPKLINDII